MRILFGLGVALWAGGCLAHTLPFADKTPSSKTAVASGLKSYQLSPNLVVGTSFNEQYLNQKIAQWSLQQVNQSLPLIDDPWVNQLIGGITAQMNAQVRHQALLNVAIIDDTAINAFAVVGGLIGLNTGTILSASTMDEVASVLAHEIAHLSQRHYEHSQDNKQKLLALQLGGLLAAIVASSVSGDLATTALIGSQTASAETLATHSREHEKEADRVGMQILAQAGYDAKAMPRFFEKLHKQTTLHQSGQAFVPSFMQSHPFTAERLSEASSRASSYPSVSVVHKTTQAVLFDQLVWRLRYLGKQAGREELFSASKYSQGATLALVAYLADEGRFDEAQRLLNTSTLDTGEPLLCITRAHVLDRQNQHQQAVDVLQACHAIYPERRDLRLYLAQALIKAGKSAHGILKPLTDQAPHDLLAWKLTQQTYENQAHLATTTAYKDMATIHALRAGSQVALWQGKYQGALQANAQARELLKTQQGQQTLQAILDKDKALILSFENFK